MWVLANIKIIAIVAAIIATFGFGSYVTRQVDENRLERALNEQQTALHAQCEEDKKITSEVSDGLQKKLSITNVRLIELKRMYAKTTCLPIAIPASRCDGSARAIALGENGITTEALFNFAGDAEKYRQQLESCQDFIRKVWSR